MVGIQPDNFYFAGFLIQISDTIIIFFLLSGVKNADITRAGWAWASVVPAPSRQSQSRSALSNGLIRPTCRPEEKDCVLQRQSGGRASEFQWVALLF